MNALTIAIVGKALDGLSLRAAATAQNIASASSPDFQPMQVSFEDSLKAAAARNTDAVRNVSLVATAVPGARGSEGRLDLELATASETALRYNALLDLLGREMQINRAAIRGGQ